MAIRQSGRRENAFTLVDLPVMSRRDRAAFTLVELLVVIGIIAVLIGILLPALGKARAQARSLACQANLRQIGQGIYIYAEVHKGVLPIGYWDGTEPIETATDYVWGPVPDGSNPSDRATNWVLLVQNTINNKFANTWTVNGGQANTAATTAKTREIFICPDAPDGENKGAASGSAISYECHPRLMPQWNTDYIPPTPGKRKPLPKPYKLGRIQRSGEIAMVFDATLALQNGVWTVYQNVPIGNALDSGRAVFGFPSSNSTFLYDDYRGTTLLPSDSVDMTPLNQSVNAFVNQDNFRNPRNIRFRHKRDTVANVLMVDGHVESFEFNPRKSSNDKTVTNFLRKNINVNRVNY